MTIRNFLVLIASLPWRDLFIFSPIRSVFFNKVTFQFLGTKSDPSIKELILRDPSSEVLILIDPSFEVKTLINASFEISILIDATPDGLQ